jgi:transaldolase
MAHAIEVNERLQALTQAGTSVWLDQIRRSLIETGELERMVREDSLRGVTSNPAIFEKSILGADEYDGQIEELTKEGRDARHIYRAIAVKDVADACDVLRPVWEESGHADGFVSLEVDPDLAHSTELTIKQAHEYWEAVDRPNLMIKIPGTDAGVPAIQQVIDDGINVNVTLLFSTESYSNIAEAFIKGMEARHERGDHLDVHSVASFFVSRVDSEVDKRLKAIGGHDALMGKAGLANARAAYMRFKELFYGDRFAKLREAGAKVQRPLWASTGVKNPAYPPTMYVDGLVAPDTVNTMPMDTLLAAAKGSHVSGATADQDPKEDLDALAEAGIDMEEVTLKLLDDGISAFVTPMEKLLAGVESKREAIVTGRPARDRVRAARRPGARDRQAHRAGRRGAHRQAHLGQGRHGLGPGRAGRGGQPPGLADDRVPPGRRGRGPAGLRLRGERGGLHGRRAARHGRLVAGARGPQAVVRRPRGRAQAHRPGLHGRRCGARRRRARPGQHARPRLHEVRRHDRDAQRVPALLGRQARGRQLRRDHRPGLVPGRARRRARLPPGVRERSRHRRPVLRAVVLRARPAALMGVDIGALLEAAGEAEQACNQFEGPNSGLWLGVTLGELALAGRDKLTFVIGGSMSSFGLWVEQLVAESTGKHGKGILPVAGEPLGAPESYGDDRTFVHLHDPDGEDDATDAQVAELVKAGHPVITVTVKSDPTDLGRIFFFAEFATAVAGWVLGINPFDQPNVAEAKDATKQVLEGVVASGGQLPEEADADDAALRALLGGGRPPTSRSSATWPSRPPRPGGHVAARGDPRAREGRHDVRLRPALPALHGPAPQGRPRRRAVPHARPPGGRGPRGPEDRVRVRDAEGRAGARRPEARCAPTACRPSA